MGRIGLVLLAAVALAACNPSAPGAGGEGGGSGGNAAFPNLFQTAYRAEITMTNPSSGEIMPAVMIRDGRKFRMEMTTPQGAMVMVSNPDSGEDFTLINAGGRQMAMRSAARQIDSPWDSWTAEVNATATATGACSGAGQDGQGWSTLSASGVVNTACVTSDGIILLAAEDGATTWETTSVQRGPQSADLFILPAGVQTMDVGSMMPAP